MCGRFIQSSRISLYAEELGLPEGQYGDLVARYNIAPTANVIVYRPQEGVRGFTTIRWGLVPHWSKGPDHRYSMINARAETVAERPAYRGPFRSGRCVIPADGFYEWRQEDGGKQPYLIRRADQRPMLFAGLWDRWEGPDGPVDSCTIIVTEANDLIRPIHDRMPAILAGADMQTWLDPQEGRPDALLATLQPFAAGEMEAYPVSRKVNRPDHDGPELVERLEGPADDS
jgi:putative SOS response-associated peptidase YedK